jgi:hypothetical protein
MIQISRPHAVTSSIVRIMCNNRLGKLSSSDVFAVARTKSDEIYPDNEKQMIAYYNQRNPAPWLTYKALELKGAANQSQYSGDKIYIDLPQVPSDVQSIQIAMFEVDDDGNDTSGLAQSGIYTVHIQGQRYGLRIMNVTVVTLYRSQSGWMIAPDMNGSETVSLNQFIS